MKAEQKRMKPADAGRTSSSLVSCIFLQVEPGALDR